MIKLCVNMKWTSIELTCPLYISTYYMICIHIYCGRLCFCMSKERNKIGWLIFCPVEWRDSYLSNLYDLKIMSHHNMESLSHVYRLDQSRRNCCKSLFVTLLHKLIFSSSCSQQCVKRVEGDDAGNKHCTGQYFDYWSCIDKCVAPKLFQELKWTDGFPSGALSVDLLLMYVNCLLLSCCCWLTLTIRWPVDYC